MGFIDYILEASADRLYETGEQDRPTRTYPCSICGLEFASTSELNVHAGEEHPLEPPGVLLDGSPVFEMVPVIRPVDSNLLTFLRADKVEVRVNNGEIEPEGHRALSALLSSPGSRVVEIAITNVRPSDGAETETHVRFQVDIPDPGALDRADAVFQQILDEEIESDEALIHRLEDRLTSISGAPKYCAALHNYMVALAIKDRTPHIGTSQPLADFQPKMQKALDVLSEFPERSLASGIAGAIRFSLNDFSGTERSLVPELDACVAVLKGISGRPDFNDTSVVDTESAEIPFDASTRRILDRWNQPGAVNELLELADEPERTPQDALKCRALALSREPREGTDLARLASELVNNNLFGSWARDLMEEAS